MRVVLQRVNRAKCVVNGEVTGGFEGAGLVALVAVTHADTTDQADWLAGKTWELRIMAGEKSASDLNAPILAVSQFTLYADARKGRRPSWNQAAPGPLAEPLFQHYVAALRGRGATVSTGVFGAQMEISLTNDGPVTLILESESTG